MRRQTGDITPWMQEKVCFDEVKLPDLSIISCLSSERKKFAEISPERCPTEAETWELPKVIGSKVTKNVRDHIVSRGN